MFWKRKLLIVLIVAGCFIEAGFGQDTSRVYLSFSGNAHPGEQITIDLNLENPVPVRGIEFYLTPSSSGLVFIAADTTSRTAGFMLADTVYPSGTLHALISDFGGGDIAVGSGAVIHLTYQVNAAAGSEIDLAFGNVIVAGPGTTSYPVVSENFPLDITFDGIRQEITGVPAEFISLNNYPNPFNPVTNIILELASTQPGKLEVYNLQGRLVRMLGDGVFTLGKHQYPWDAKDAGGHNIPSGIYICRFKGSQQTTELKLLLLR